MEKIETEWIKVQKIAGAEITQAEKDLDTGSNNMEARH